MTANEFNASIRQCLPILRGCGILRSMQAITAREPGEEFRRISLNRASTYKDVFLCGLRESEYNYLLHDYSFLQFGYRAANEFRLAYYPSPFDQGGEERAREMDEALAEGVLSFEEYSHVVSELPYDVRVPILRYELHCDAYAPLRHPASHFHIGMHSESRWPVGRRLTPRVFTLLVSKLFYYSSWNHHGTVETDEMGFSNLYDRMFADEKRNCTSLEERFFDERERGQLHFT